MNNSILSSFSFIFGWQSAHKLRLEPYYQVRLRVTLCIQKAYKTPVHRSKGYREENLYFYEYLLITGSLYMYTASGAKNYIQQNRSNKTKGITLLRKEHDENRIYIEQLHYLFKNNPLGRWQMQLSQVLIFVTLINSKRKGY